MNLSDVSVAADNAVRLALLRKIAAEGPTAAVMHITTSTGTYDFPLTLDETGLGMSQIQNEIVQRLTGLGVTV